MEAGPVSGIRLNSGLSAIYCGINAVIFQRPGSDAVPAILTPTGNPPGRLFFELNGPRKRGCTLYVQKCRYIYNRKEKMKKHFIST